MALSRTWYTDAGIAIANSSTAALAYHSLIWTFKALLKGTLGAGVNGLWTIEGSSNASAAALDGADRWLDTFTDSAIVAAAAGTAHSWIVLKSPNAMGPVYLCMDLNAAAASGQVTFVPAWSAFTGGTTLNRPTSTTESVPATLVLYDMAAASNGKVSKVVDADGNFWLLWNKFGTGNISTLIGFQTLIDTRAGDTRKTWFFQSALHEVGAFGKGALNAISGASNSPFWGNYCSGRSYTGTAAITNTATWQNWEVGGSQNYGVQTGRNNSIDGAVDLLPLWLVENSAGSGGIRGRVPDCSISNSGLPVGTQLPAGAPPERMLVGTVYIPFTAVYSVG